MRDLLCGIPYMLAMIVTVAIAETRKRRERRNRP